MRGFGGGSFRGGWRSLGKELVRQQDGTRGSKEAVEGNGDKRMRVGGARKYATWRRMVSSGRSGTGI